MKKLASSNPNLRLSSSQFAETSHPTFTSDVQPEITTPPFPYENKLTPIDQNDSFDRTSLLKKIPTSSRKRAEQLLIAFDSRPNELTWDCKGVIFVDEEAIPNSSIFHLFPFLFNQRPTGNLTGFDDFWKKIDAMGLSHLATRKKTVYKSQKQSRPHSHKNESDAHWWYLGE